MTDRRRKTLAELLRAGMQAQRDFVAARGYYDTDEKVENRPLFTPAPPHVLMGYTTYEAAHEAGPFFGIDPIMMIFIGKFGPEILGTIGLEHRRSFDHGWDAGRVWDREHVNERLTKAINGGVSDLFRRLHDLPRLYRQLTKRGYRGEAKYTSVFRAITFLSDTAALAPDEIAGVLEEARV